MRYKLILFIVLLVGCKSNVVENSKDNSSTDIPKTFLKDTFAFNQVDTIRSLKLPVFINIYSFCEDSIIGQKAEVVKRKVLNGYNIFGKLFTKGDKIGIIKTDSKNIIFLYIYNTAGKLMSKTAITSIIKIPNGQFLIGKYLKISKDLNIESAFITDYTAIDYDSIILATVKSDIWVAKYKIDSVGQIISIK